MRGKRNFALWIGLVLAVSLCSASLTAALLLGYYRREHIRVLGELCREVTERCPEAEQAVLSAVKSYKDRREASAEEYRDSPSASAEENKGWQAVSTEKYRDNPPAVAGESILAAYGYSPSDFLPYAERYNRIFAFAGFLTSIFLIFLVLFFDHRGAAMRIRALTDYLERVNTGGDGNLLLSGEDDFSRLQDEIYKTVTMLRQTRDTALRAKSSFAENLYNIAHQLKTPITSISLSVQMLRKSPSLRHMEQIDRQLSRLTHLEEALLLLSRIDAGTLVLESTEVDVFTVLMLAADNLQELCSEAQVFIDIPEAGRVSICADLEWTMEALMNLFKNCMEHTLPGGTIHCMYEQNPLYVQIRIWDDGAGFAKEDLPHLFERFYRGKNAADGGIGIGLSLSKAIIERQNGTITARNLAGGGACFEIHLYLRNYVQ